MDFIAHIRGSDGEYQFLKDHLKEVMKIAEEIGGKLGISHVSGLAGMLHDMGKYSDEFQLYLREAYNNPDNPPKRGSVNHSTAGGKFLMENYHISFNSKSKISPVLIECVSNAIYSHHGQLLDMVDSEGKSPFMDRAQPAKAIDFEQVYERFFNEVCDEQTFSQYIQKANLELQSFLSPIGKLKSKQEAIAGLNKALAFLTKFIFSALIDADRKNSKEFEENTTSFEHDTKKLFKQFENELVTSLREKQINAVQNQITKLRQQMSENCFEKATLPTGIYTLSIPTGGGKTLASLRFALQHAQIHGKTRIVNVIPFTTIIEQNAEEVRNILNAKNYVLEHHSNVVMKEIEFEENNNFSFKELQQSEKLRNAKDDWNAPIIFTTMVQFLNTFFDGASRNTRRLHNLANSIIIFDEVQTVPVSCISLFNEAINFLKDFCHTTIILCTATQPALEYVEKKIQVDGELIDNLGAISKAFKRTEVIPLMKNDSWNTEELAQFVKEKVNECGNVLVILNTKNIVKQLFDKLNVEDFQVYHLSTSMCPSHRKSILKEVRHKLKVGEKIVCISTQLIEAGVDVSFNCVIRSLAGLDSIAQAAGRCNRHGEADIRDVFVINNGEEKLDKLRTIQEGKRCTEYIIKDILANPALFEGNLLSSSAIHHYFQMFYKTFEYHVDYPINELNTSIYEILLGENKFKKESPYKNKFKINSSFKTAAEHFEVIEGNTYTIIVPYGDGKELISTLTGSDLIGDYNSFFKKAQQCSVNIFKYEFDQLIKNSLIRKVELGFSTIYIAMETAYDKSYGLSVGGNASLELYDI